MHLNTIATYSVVMSANHGDPDIAARYAREGYERQGDGEWAGHEGKPISGMCHKTKLLP